MGMIEKRQLFLFQDTDSSSFLPFTVLQDIIQQQRSMVVSPAGGPGSGNGNSGTQGRSLTPSSYHQQHNIAATSSKKRLHNHQAGRQNPHSLGGPGGMKRSKLAQAASAGGPFPIAVLPLPDTPLGGKASSNNGFKRGIYLAFVDNALQEKSKVGLLT